MKENVKFCKTKLPLIKKFLFCYVDADNSMIYHEKLLKKQITQINSGLTGQFFSYRVKQN